MNGSDAGGGDSDAGAVGRNQTAMSTNTPTSDKTDARHAQRRITAHTVRTETGETYTEYNVDGRVVPADALGAGR